MPSKKIGCPPFWVLASKASNGTFKKIKLSGEDDPHLPELRKHSHGMVNMEQEHYIAELGTNGSSRFVSSGNGGEYRKTFHGFVSAILVC